MRLRNKDIAKELSISTTAVSLALNNKPGVSDETRQKVLEMVRRSAEKTFNTYEHKQDQQKGSLLFSVHKRHGEVINDKPFFSDLVATAQQEAMRSGYTLLLANYLPGQDIQQYIDYLNTLRLRKACEALLHSEISVREIAQKVGFSEVTYFISAFGKGIGETPLQYRKNHSS